MTAQGNGPHDLPVTGDPVVDEAVALLHTIDVDARPEERLPVLAAVHHALQQRLSSAVE